MKFNCAEHRCLFLLINLNFLHLKINKTDSTRAQLKPTVDSPHSLVWEFTSPDTYLLFTIVTCNYALYSPGKINSTVKESPKPMIPYDIIILVVNLHS